MRLCIVHNPNAGHANDAAPLHEAIATRDDVTLVEPATPEALREAVRQAARSGAEVVAAAGGDGTVHAVANALLAAGDSAETRPALAIVPVGTGNDLARTLAVPFDAAEALALVEGGRRAVIEAIRVEPMDAEACFAVNMGNGGFTGQMRETLTDALKGRWGPLAYVVAAAETLPRMQRYAVRLTFDDAKPEAHRLFNVVVAAGRTAGGGRPAAPTANPEDGLLEVVLVRAGTTTQVAGLAARALAGADVLASDLVEVRRARRLHVEAEPPMRFAIDGEMKAETPVAFEAIPRALRVVVGEGYRAEPA